MELIKEGHLIGNQYKFSKENVYNLGKNKIECGSLITSDSLWSKFLFGLIVMDKWDSDWNFIQHIYDKIIDQYKQSRFLINIEENYYFCNPNKEQNPKQKYIKVMISKRDKEIISF